MEYRFKIGDKVVLKGRKRIKDAWPGVIYTVDDVGGRLFRLAEIGNIFNMSDFVLYDTRQNNKPEWF